MHRSFAVMMAPYARQIKNMLGRGIVTMVNTSSRMQQLQVRLGRDDLKDGMEHFEHYGMTSHPPAGAEALAGFLQGDRSHGVVIAVAHRQYRLQGLEAGEVAIYDDLGQKVHLTRDGIVISGAGLPVTLTDCPKVRMETPLLEVTGEIIDRCSSDGRTMHAMRETYNIHTHHENNTGDTSTPNQLI